MSKQHVIERLKQIVPAPARNALRPLKFRLRLLRTAVRANRGHRGTAPGVVLIGAMKSGTTSLFNYLAAHPAITPPIVKEIDYFSYNWCRGDDWYRAHFPTTPRDTITAEASSGYLPYPRAAGRVHETLPDTRIVAVLRDPVARAISHYFHERRAGREHRSISEAMRAPEADRAIELLPDDECDWYRAFQGRWPGDRRARRLVEAHPIHRAYVWFSRYAEHLGPWLDRFGEGSLMVLRSEDLFADPSGQTARVLSFLGLSAATQPTDAMVFNPGQRANVDAGTRRYLETTLAASNRKLADLLGEEFRW